MKLPPGAFDAVFEKEFVRGVVLRAELRFQGGAVKPKFFALLNRSPGDAVSLFFVTTSRVDFFARHPQVEHVRIPAKHLPFLPLETVIDCRTVHTLDRADLKKRYREGVLEIAGSLPPELLQKIDVLVAGSRLISARHKEAILGSGAP